MDSIKRNNKENKKINYLNENNNEINDLNSIYWNANKDEWSNECNFWQKYFKNAKKINCTDNKIANNN